MTTRTKLKFKDFIKLQRGFDLPKDTRLDGQFPVVASTSINGYHNEYKVSAPCVTTGRSGALGEVLFISENCWPLNTTLWVKNFYGNDPKFVYYKLKTLQLESFNSGAGVPTLNRNHLDQMQISIPDNQTQQTIATALSLYDSLIENNEKRIRILEEMAQRLYTEWFVKFKFPGHKKVKMVDGFPEDWEEKSFYDVVKNSDSIRKPLSRLKRKNIQGDIPYYGAAKIIDHIQDYIFDGRYLLIAEDGSVITTDGKPVLQFVDEKFWVSNHAHVVQGNLISTEVIYLRMSKLNIRPLITGAAQPKITKDNLSRVMFVIPEEKIKRQFEKLAKVYFDEIFNLKKQTKKLTLIRDLLIPQLLTGKRVLKNND